MVAVEIVGDGDAAGAEGAQVIDGPAVGRVERKVRDERDIVLTAKLDAGKVADQPAVGAMLGHRVEDAQLVRLLNAGRGEIDFDVRCAGLGDGWPIFADVGKFDHHAADIARDHRVELIERAAEDAQFRIGGSRRDWQATRSRPASSRDRLRRGRARLGGGLQLRDHRVPQLAEHAERNHRLASMSAARDCNS